MGFYQQEYWSGLPFPPPVDHVLSELSTITITITWTSQVVNTEIRLIMFFAAKDGDALYSQRKTRPGADCGSDHQFLIAKFRLKSKQVGKNHSAIQV